MNSDAVNNNFGDQPMSINKANRVLGHDEACDVIAGQWSAARLATKREVLLPSGKVADVMANERAGDVLIAEVKLDLKASLIEEALEKYGRWCNYLYFAVPCIVAADVLRRVPTTGFPAPWHRVGLIGVYPGTILVLRTPSYRQIGSLDALAIDSAFRTAADR